MILFTKLQNVQFSDVENKILVFKCSSYLETHGFCPQLSLLCPVKLNFQFKLSV